MDGQCTGIQGPTKTSNQSWQNIVDYTQTFFSEGDEELENHSFDIRSSKELFQFDCYKQTLGVERARDRPKYAVDKESNQVHIVPTGNVRPLQGVVKIVCVKKGSRKDSLGNVKLTEAAWRQLEVVQSSQINDKNHAFKLACDFFRDFDSHFVVGECDLGAMFEYVVVCDPPGHSFKSISKEILKVAKSSKLPGSTSGIWYSAEQFLSEAGSTKFTADQLQSYRLRLSKFGGKNKPCSFSVWKESYNQYDGCVPLSYEEDFQLLPVWCLIQDSQFQSLLRRSWISIQRKCNDPIETSDVSVEMEPLREAGLSKENVVRKLGVEKFFKGKISLQEVMCIELKDRDEKSIEWSELPFVILKKLIMMDHNARDHLQDRCHPQTNSGGTSSALADMLAQQSQISIHPLDIFLIVFECCDAMLKQVLAKKMFMCRLAIPFLIPDGEHYLLLSLWALETTILEWRDAENQARSESITRCPMQIVSFIRAGRHSFSKSNLLNAVLANDKHLTFSCFESPHGTNSHPVADGMVELAHFLPSDSTGASLKQELILLNLRGDCTHCERQVEVLQKISAIIVLVLDVDAMDEMKHFLGRFNSSRTVLLMTHLNTPSTELLQKCDGICKQFMSAACQTTTFTIGKKKNLNEIKSDVIVKCNAILSSRECMVKKALTCHAVDLAQSNTVTVDELVMGGCQAGEKEVRRILPMSKPSSDFKNTMLLLQGESLHKWADLQKEKYRTKQCRDGQSLESVKYEIQKAMDMVRQEQEKICASIPSAVVSIIRYLQQAVSHRTKLLFFVRWLKIELDQRSRATLPKLYQEYQSQLEKCSLGKGQQEARNTLRKEQKESLAIIEGRIANSTLGFEHVMRELGQIYEAASNKDSQWSSLPNIAAILLQYGVPFELMDGDAACVPLIWIKAVLKHLKRIIGDKKMFVLSVVGIQSSGKSTLLNTMFGLEFAVSAGRCTRGIYAQLLQVNQQKCSLPFDYMLVLDSEGLRAPELAQDKHHHDNQLASFIIGLADLTLINLKGENVDSMRDVLQIVVHAFLRMKQVDKSKKQRCMFIHQNVAAVNAGEQMLQGYNALIDNLNTMTKEVAETENRTDIQYFNQVINFRGQQDVFCMSDLWHGDPPMAPVNSGYARKAEELCNGIFKRFIEEQPRVLLLSDFITRIEDLWTAILADDFVFSFKNSLAIKAHLIMERKFSEMKFNLEQHILTEKALKIQQLRKLRNIQNFDEEVEKAIQGMKRIINDKQIATHKLLQQFFDSSEYRDILEDFRQPKLLSLKTSTEVLEQQIVQNLQSLKNEQCNLKNSIMRIKGLEEKLTQEAGSYATELKGKDLSDREISDKFEHLWTTFVEPEPEDITTTVIQTKMESILLRELGKEGSCLEHILPFLRGQVLLEKDLKSGINETSISKKHFERQKKKGYKKMKRKVGRFFSDDKKQEELKQITACINVVLTELNVFLESLVSPDSVKKTFYLNCREYVQTVLDNFQLYLDKPIPETRFQLTKEWKATFSAHAVYCAIRKFDEHFGSETTEDSAYAATIRGEIESVLLKEFDVRGQQTHIKTHLVSLYGDSIPPVSSLDGSITSDEIEDNYISLTEKGKVKGKEKHYTQEKVAEALNRILKDLDTKLASICSKDARFYSLDGTQFISEVLTSLEDFNNDKKERAKHYILTWDCIAYVSILAAHHAILKFEAMNIGYDLKYGTATQLEEHKTQVKKSFLHLVKETEIHMTAAEEFCDVMQREITSVVNSIIANKVPSILVKKIGFTKHDFMVLILKDLAQRGDFEAYMGYIHNAHQFATRWARSFTNTQVFNHSSGESSSLFQQIARQEVEEMIQFVIYQVKVTARQTLGSQDESTRKKEWFSCLSNALEEKRIDVKEDDLKKMKTMHVIDFEKLAYQIEKQLTTVADNVKKQFCEVSEHSVQWGETTPYLRIMETLWGCKEQCPFCGEPCKHTDLHHQHCHECLQHLPHCIRGWEDQWGNPIIDNCSMRVTSISEIYMCKDTKVCNCITSSNFEYHKYNEYKKYLPKWNIAPDNAGESAKYWKWFVCTYKDKLVEKYQYPMPEIPGSWHSITRSQAIDSLNLYVDDQMYS